MLNEASVHSHVELTLSNAPVMISVPAFVRTRSEVKARFERSGAATRLIDHYETGGLRLRLPNSPAGCDGVIINTAGGMTGGDTCRFVCEAGSNARVRLTTQSAEKVYRTDGPPATVFTDLTAGNRAFLTWVPQETILFDGASLIRTLNVTMAESASVLLLEMTVLGRVARGERMTSGLFLDRWRVSRSGRLIFADDIRLDGDMATVMEGAATGGGAAAIATLLYIAPNAEARLNSVRAALDTARSHVGASAWNGMLAVRFAAADPADVRRDVAQALARVARSEPPRMWAV